MSVPNTVRTEQAGSMSVLTGMPLSEVPYLCVRPREFIKRPENNLWVIVADSHQLDQILVDAVVHGK